MDILALLNQAKTFLMQEKGSLVSLIIYVFIGLAIASQFTPFLSDDVQQSTNMYIAATVTIISFGLWLVTRRLGRQKRLINIGIAQMDLLNISTDSLLTAEQKVQISSEVTNYIYNRLSHLKQAHNLEKDLNFVQLPPRITVNYANCETLSEKVGFDIIIRGTLRYDEQKIYINTKFSFAKHINSIFFEKLVDDLNAYPEIQFSFSENINLEFDKFIHEVVYISILYRALNLINRLKYREAETILLYGIDKLEKLYNDVNDQSVNRGDKEAAKIEVLLYFVLAKNYLAWANMLLGSFDYKNIANDKLDKCSAIIRHQLKIMKQFSHDTSFGELQEKIQLENSYLYAMSKLSLTNNKSAVNAALKEVSDIIKEEYKHDMVKALVAVKFKDFTDAKKNYESALKQNPQNVVVLRGLGLLEGKLGHYTKSLQHLLKLTKLSKYYIFEKGVYDTRVEYNISRAYWKLGKVIPAVRHLVTYSLYKFYNHTIINSMYTLK